MTGARDEQSLEELLIEMDRLEELREEMEERGLRTIEDIEERILDLNRLADQRSGDRR